jgi:cell division protein FtsB
VSELPRRRAVTGRALVLGAVVVLLLVLLASPLNRYIASRGDAGRAATQFQQDQQALQQLQQQQKLWSDPGYIQQQARQRLMYAMPGDTVYVVVNKGQKSDIEKSATSVQAAPAGSWNERLWRSVQVAGG